MKRRTLLAALGTAGTTGLAGCSGLLDDELPAGSLHLENRHDLPHIVRMTVTDVGSDGVRTDDGYDVRGDVTIRPEQRRLQTSISVAPNEIKTFEAIFTEPVTYLIEFTVDGVVPENAVYPFSPGVSSRGNYTYLDAEVYGGGKFSASFSTTDVSGPFDD
ncbi:hypothetical protein [Salinibaculum rarum]|uniref:hypothetical protein n=1 Tax=Salinibaculum rarum TaxID=3058903 RepID=UPI00265F86C6|nr:hypothetical protein [Salinibaculum sp. KK48]